MARGLGFYSGKLEGEQTLQQMALRREQQNNANRSQLLDEERFKLNQKDTEDNLLSRSLNRENLRAQMNYAEVEQQRKDEAYKIAQQERDLASKAMAARIPGMINDQEVSENEKFAMQLENTAKAVSSVNPKLAADYYKQAQDVKSNNLKQKTDSLSLKQNRMEMQREVATMVNDQTTLDMAVQSLADLGVQVPMKFREWSPETQAWWAGQSRLAKTQIDSTKATATMLRAEQDRIDTTSKVADREAKIQLAEQKETRLRDNLTKSKGLAKYEPKRILQERKLLADQDERFDDLDGVVQKAVAEDVLSLANLYLKQDPSMDQAMAMQKARRDVLGRIDEKGEYQVVSKQQSAPQAALDMLKANPALAPQFKAKFGYLPEGY